MYALKGFMGLAYGLLGVATAENQGDILPDGPCQAGPRCHGWPLQPDTWKIVSWF